MNANVTKTSTGKLLVAVFAMFMIVAGAAVVLSDSTADAAHVSDINSAMQKGDYTLTESLTISEQDTLDLNGKTLTIATGGVINMTGGTITNGTIVGSGIGYGITVTSGTATISKISASGFAQWPVYVMSAQNSNVNITGCEFDSTNTPMKSAVYIGGVSTVAISNSTFNGEYAQGAVNLDMGSSNDRAITVTITNEAANTVSIGTCRGDIIIGNSNASANVKVDANTSVTEIVMDDNNQYSGTNTVRCGVTFASTMSVDTIRGNGDVNASTYTVNVVNTEVDGTITGTNYKSDNYATSNFDQIKALLDAGTPEVYVNGDLELTNNLTVKNTTTLYIENAEITRAAGSDYKITVTGGVLDIDNSYLYIPVSLDEDATFNANNTHDLSSTGILNDNTQVGFGDTLTLSGTVPDKVIIDVYGSLVTNDLVVNGTVNAYEGSDIAVNGTVTVAKAFNMDKAEMELAGTITVRNDQTGNATFTLENGSKVTVLENGTFNVNRATGNNANANTLSILDTSEFIVEGTLNITGTLAGQVQDKGTISFNGTSSGASIVLYDGITLDIASVTGTMTIVDNLDVILDYAGKESLSTSDNSEAASYGNEITLNNVRGVSITQDVVDSMNDRASGNEKTRVYTANMTVTGTVSKVTTQPSGYVTIDGKAIEIGTMVLKRAVSGTMTVGDISFGRNLAVNFQNDVEISGTFNANIAQASNDGGISITNTGELTVSGTMVLGEGVTETLSATNINAAYYAVTTTGTGTTVTEYYTNFANAIAAIADADDDMIRIYGDVDVDANATVADGMTVQVQAGGKLAIKSDVELTVADGGVLDVTNGNANNKAVGVSGVLIITNNGTGLVGNANAIDYDVLKTVGNTDTYSSLAYALSVAQPGETITLSKGVTLKNDTTIPEGVTLETGRNNVTLNDRVTLTVNGTFTVQSGSIVTLKGNGNDKADIIVNGVMSKAGSDFEIESLKISGAYFTLRSVDYVTNVAYAAQNVDRDTITIMGQVSFGDVTFTADNSGLDINVQNFADATAENATVVSGGTITLDGATFSIRSGTVTATVSAAAGDSVASVQLNRVAGVANAEEKTTEYNFSIDSTTRSTIDGDVDIMVMNGYVNAGTATVVSGTVTSGSSLVVNSDNFVTGTGAIIINEGATLEVPEASAIYAQKNTKDDTITVFTVNGTVDLDGTFYVYDDVLIAGTMNVNDGGNLSINAGTVGTGNLTVTGTIAVVDTADETGNFTINNTGCVTMGVNPTAPGQAAGAGTITGPVDFAVGATGYIKAYIGSDLSGAKIEWNDATDESGAVSTVFNINNEPYMTVYVLDGASVSIQSVLNSETFELVGYDVGYKVGGGLTEPTLLYNVSNWYTDAAMQQNQKVTSTYPDIGDDANANIYAAAEASYVDGVISEGTGLDLYIDNIRWDPTNQMFDKGLQVGTHTVSFEVTAGYDGTDATITFNGQTVENGGTITIEAGATTFTLVANGAVPSSGQIVIDGGDNGGSDGMGLTDYLLIILVVLIVIMAIMVAMRLMRS